MSEQSEFSIARRHMVESQLRPNRLTDERLIQVLSEVPREAFVPAALKSVAYLDRDLEVAPGRHLMAPMVLARLLQEARVAAHDVVLDLGCASGYSAAVLARLAASVVALEADAELAAWATATLPALDIDNVAVVEAPLPRGLPDQGPYDLIFIAGAVPEVPADLLDQIAEGGRLTAVLDRGAGLGRATLYQRLDGLVAERALFDATCRPLPGFERAPSFVF